MAAEAGSLGAEARGSNFAQDFCGSSRKHLAFSLRFLLESACWHATIKRRGSAAEVTRKRRALRTLFAFRLLRKLNYLEEELFMVFVVWNICKFTKFCSRSMCPREFRGSFAEAARKVTGCLPSPYKIPF
jgi:hypothetical protein